MKRILFCVSMTLLPGLVLAQKADDYRPGKWYAGLIGEVYQINMARPEDVASVGGGWGLMGGYHLSPHFNVQLGLMAAHQQNAGGIVIYDNGKYVYMNRQFVNSALYAPMTVQYVPFGSGRRWQPYLSLGLNTLVGKTQNQTEFFGTPVREDGTKVMFNWRTGMGTRVRLVQRLHLSLGLDLIVGFRPRFGSSRSASGGAGLHAGLNYDFGTK